MKFKVVEDSDLVSVCYKKADSTLQGFLDIYPDEDECPSPFESIEECRLFAKIVVKLLESVIE